MSSQSHPLIRLLRYGYLDRRYAYGAITASILNQILDLAPPVLIGMAVDIVVKQEDSLIASWGFVELSSQLAVLSFLTLIIWGLESISEYIYDTLWRNLAQTIQHDLRLEAYGHLQELEMSFFEERSTGKLLAILNDDVNQLERFLDRGVNDVLQVATTVVVIGTCFLILAPSVAWMAMLPIPFILWGALTFQEILAPRYETVREQAGLIAMRLANNLSGIATIKSFAAEEYERERIEVESEAYRCSNREAIAFSAAFVPLIRILILVSFTTTLFFGGLLTVQGNLAVGIYSVLIFITQRLLWPLTYLGETFDLYQRAMASTNRVMDLLDTPNAIPSGDQFLSVQQMKGEVVFRDVTFAYGDLGNVLTNLSLQVPASKMIGIVGPTGSGKSTMVKLLLRFYELEQGQITIDGHDIRKLNLQNLRRCIALVSQDVFLFHGSVKENIAYGSSDFSLEKIIDAAKLAEAHEFITQLPQGYDTIIGERGQKLSGGQRQRLAIARAIIKDTPILVFDEATSAVDNETEAAIKRALNHITQNRTTLIIAHRLSTIRYASCIYLMTAGQIAEHGTHEQLLALDGSYANLWRMQCQS